MIRLRLSWLVLVVVAACTPSARTAPVPKTDYDLLIINGRIVDGAGNPWYRGSVGVKGDRIAYVGPSVSGMSSKYLIDAKDQVIAPGFIDMLGHSEFTLLRRPQAVSKITQGITSEITGEVSSAWPQVALGDTLTRDAPWTSLDGYFRYDGSSSEEAAQSTSALMWGRARFVLQ